jgi:hypothetical protein
MPKLLTSMQVLDELRKLFNMLDKRSTEALSSEEKNELEIFSEESIQRLKKLIKPKEK